jgi:hypothetical protein
MKRYRNVIDDLLFKNEKPPVTLHDEKKFTVTIHYCCTEKEKIFLSMILA